MMYDEEDDFDKMYADELEVMNSQPIFNNDDDDDGDALQKYAEECSSSIRMRPMFKSKRSLTFSSAAGSSEVGEIVRKNLNVDELLSAVPDGTFVSESLNGDACHLVASWQQSKCSENQSAPKKRSRSEKQDFKKLHDSLIEANPCKKLKLQVESASLERATSLETKNSTNKELDVRIPNGEFISMTTSHGKVYYLSVVEAKQQHQERQQQPTCSNLLALPVSVMKLLLFEQRQLKKMEKRVQNDNSSKMAVAGDNGSMHSSNKVCDAEDGRHHGGMAGINSTGRTVVETNLWVDKYAPRRYSDLISQESTNRSLLRWLKLWDHTCFHKEVIHSNSVSSNISKNASHANVIDGLDGNKRPYLKVALISGPPGLGKTTLAHVIARHAGYNVVEMNASDDRTVESFREKIESSTQMTSVLSLTTTNANISPRPNCLIIDEIDGAPQPAIDVLLNLIKNSDPTTTPASTSTTTKAARKKEHQALLRPIICICNDLYAPSLRLLRQCSFLLTFQPSVTSQLAIRLLEISRMEGLLSDLSTMMCLCEKADHDIRSCINTIQFVKSKHGDELNLKMVTSLSLGQKDVHKNLFNLWAGIFTLPKPSRKRYVNPHDQLSHLQQLNEQQHSNTSYDRFSNLLRQLSAEGEHAKVQQGLFDNYLISNAKDSRMDNLVEAIDWLCYADVMNSHQSEEQDYSMMRYAPFIGVAFHFIFAVSRPHKIAFPKSQFEFQTNLSRRNELLTSVIQKIHPSIRPFVNKYNMVLEMLPYISEVIKPALRPVNVQLYSRHEKMLLSNVVQTMLTYNLSYLQCRTPDGRYNYVIEPNIHDVVNFFDSKTSRQMSYSCKQLVAREIELEKMRRLEMSKSQDPRCKSEPAVSKSSTPSNKQPAGHLRRMLQPQPLEQGKEIKVQVDFFGRKIDKQTQKPAKHNNSGGATEEPQQQANDSITSTKSVFSDVWYRYKEGFTNAVKRSVKVADFL